MDTDNIRLADSDHHVAKIKVIGVGGCGSNLVDYMSKRPTSGVDFVAVNTDSQALASVNSRVECIQIGTATTKGLGAGGKPEVARDAAEAEEARLRDVIAGMDMVFVVAGMGKGTGTGASPVVARMARDMGVLTVALVVMPFDFENRKKRAEGGLAELAKQVDSLIIAPNEKLQNVLADNVTISEAYLAANDLLYNAVCGVSDIINKHGQVNVDFNDVRSAMEGKGKAVIGSAAATGEERAATAAEAALRSDLMENIDLAGCSHVLVNISGNNITISEMNQVVNVVRASATDMRGDITHGLCSDESMGEELRVTIIITGVSDHYHQPKIVDAGDAVAAEDAKAYFSSGRRRREVNQQMEESGGKRHHVPAVMRRQTN